MHVKGANKKTPTPWMTIRPFRSETSWSDATENNHPQNVGLLLRRGEFLSRQPRVALDWLPANYHKNLSTRESSFAKERAFIGFNSLELHASLWMLQDEGRIDVHSPQLKFGIDWRFDGRTGTSTCHLYFIRRRCLPTCWSVAPRGRRRLIADSSGWVVVNWKWQT